ncbi:hypothetical protein [Corynebacterium epidermidicanis]|uniref:Uncharacterized protein n=1 Tax=Corynebacterium epidermidicanis TaxID=1050174 RepID=A0A0G3GTM4_9CORY|nr:hypothetical protein [Corynebacterium epidermidicanis]AKK02162.1 hypothetical protein CEPID_01380 [Corynebacterium epidermidicanis]
MSIFFSVLTPVVLAIFAIQMEKFEAFSTRHRSTPAQGAPDVEAEN